MGSWWRWNRSVAVGLVVVFSLALPIHTRAQEDKRTGTLSWADAPVTARHRSQADWLVDAGWKTPTEVFGPFPTREYRPGDAERLIPLGSFSSRPETFVMAYRSEHAYFWFERGTRPDSATLNQVADIFEQHIWPLNNAIYGEEWNPGIDGDSRLHVINQENIGGGILGGFNPEDQCPRFLCPDSNQREIIYISLRTAPLGSDMYLTTLAHEHQHLIQFHVDGNEERWFNEGLSQLAEHLNGFEPGLIGDYSVLAFLANPDHHLNGWTANLTDLSPYYGASYLFLVYLYEQFGLDFIRVMAGSNYDGLASVQAALNQTGQELTVDDVFGNWTIANLLDDPYTGGGRYYYRTLNLPGSISPVMLVDDGSGYHQIDTLNQYGADYLGIDRPGSYTLSFDGSDDARMIGASPHSRDWMWWSYNGENSAARLTGAFDLTGLSAATLVFSVWWQTENERDWLHVLVSDNDGKTWQIVGGERAALRGQMAPGAHYTGQSTTWIDEQIDLRAYAGRNVLIRFEYLTDGKETLPGVVLDDIGILQLGRMDDVEELLSAWEPEGFLRIPDTVAQNWALAVVVYDADGKVSVERVRLDAPNTGRAVFTVPEGGRATLVIGAMAPFTAYRADYKLIVQPAS